MISVVIVFQLFQQLFTAQPHPVRHQVYVLAHLREHLLLCYTADSGIVRVHADILDVVQLAEDTQLRELGDACQEDESQPGVAGLERAVEIAHDLAQHRQVALLVHYVQQRGVVFVNEHHYLPAGLM